MSLSEYYEKQRRKLIAEIIRKLYSEDPIVAVTLEEGTLRLRECGKRSWHVGRIIIGGSRELTIIGKMHDRFTRAYMGSTIR